MSDDLNILQELLDSEPVMTALGFPIDAAAAVQAIRRLREVAPGDDAGAVRDGWDALAGAVGPKLTAALLSGPEWRSFCPIGRPLDDYDSSDVSQVVWIGNGQRVIAQAVMDGGALLGVRFDIV